MNRKDFLKFIGTALASLPLARFIRPREITKITTTNAAVFGIDYATGPDHTEILQVINVDTENETITVSPGMQFTLPEFLVAQAIHKNWVQTIKQNPNMLKNYENYRKATNGIQKEN